jgi:flagellar biosynthetic protein FliR
MVDAALLNWTLQQFLKVIIILVRVGPLIFFMPITGSGGVPVQIKVLFALLTALVLAPVVNVPVSSLPSTPLGFALFVLTEVAFAGILSLFARLVFAAVQLAGQYISISMGMGMAATIDPQFGTQTSLIGIFWNLLAILLFLAINGHHIFITTMVDSFQWVRPGTLHLQQATFNGMMTGVMNMFVLGVKVMAPAGAVLLFSHVAMGILAKTVPQIPVLIVAMPLDIALGFIFVGLSLTFFVPLMLSNFAMLGRLLPRLAMGLGG